MQYACVWARKGTKRTSEKAQAHPFAWLHSDVRSFYFHNSQLTNSTGLHSLLAHVINKITCVILLCANTCVRACVDLVQCHFTYRIDRKFMQLGSSTFTTLHCSIPTFYAGIESDCHLNCCVWFSFAFEIHHLQFASGHMLNALH